MKWFLVALLVLVVAVCLPWSSDSNVGTFFLAIRGLFTGLMDRSRMEPHYLETRNVTSVLSGKKCLVTGTSRGLGKSIAIELLSLGCDVFMAQRVPTNVSTTNHADATAAERAAFDLTGRCGKATVLPLELADTDSVQECAKILAKKKIKLDVVVLNAAIVPAKLTLTADGFESGFRVNFLGHFDLTHALLSNGVLVPPKGTPMTALPKMIVILSECHRMSDPVDVSKLGEIVEFTTSGALERYGHTKLCLGSFGTHLGQKLSTVFYDPGPVNTDISREAPEWLQPYVKWMMSTFFKSPEAAARPVGFLATNNNNDDDDDDDDDNNNDNTENKHGNSTNYMVYWSSSEIRKDASDLTKAKALWVKAEELLLTRVRAPPKKPNNT